MCPTRIDSTRTIVLHYRVLDALRFFEDHDELYWNVTGNEWENSIELATAHIVLPAGVTGLRAVAYTGVTGSRTEDAHVESRTMWWTSRAREARVPKG